MAWTASKIFTAFQLDVVANTAAFDLAGAGLDTFKNALFDNSITPSQTVSSAASAFGGGVWASGEAFQAGQWATGGVALTSPAATIPSGSTIAFDAADTSSGAAATLTAYGCLIYDDTLATPVADQGVCYLYLGGQQTVTGGQLTVVYASSPFNALWYITL